MTCLSTNYMPCCRSVVSCFARLTGRMALGPRWSLGFALTAMPLADAPDAQARILHAKGLEMME